MTMEIADKINKLLAVNKKRQQEIDDNLMEMKRLLLEKCRNIYTGKTIDMLVGTFIVDTPYMIEYDTDMNCFFMHAQGKFIHNHDIGIYPAYYAIDYFAEQRFKLTNNGDLAKGCEILNNYAEERFPAIEEYFKKVCSSEGKPIKRHANVAFINSAGHGIRGYICGFHEDTMHYEIMTEGNQADGQSLIFKAGPELILI